MPPAIHEQKLFRSLKFDVEECSYYERQRWAHAERKSQREFQRTFGPKILRPRTTPQTYRKVKPISKPARLQKAIANLGPYRKPIGECTQSLITIPQLLKSNGQMLDMLSPDNHSKNSYPDNAKKNKTGTGPTFFPQTKLEDGVAKHDFIAQVHSLVFDADRIESRARVGKKLIPRITALRPTSNSSLASRPHRARNSRDNFGELQVRPFSQQSGFQSDSLASSTQSASSEVGSIRSQFTDGDSLREENPSIISDSDSNGGEIGDSDRSDGTVSDNKSIASDDVDAIGSDNESDVNELDDVNDSDEFNGVESDNSGDSPRDIDEYQADDKPIASSDDDDIQSDSHEDAESDGASIRSSEASDSAAKGPAYDSSDESIQSID